jgi:hypothetical protein
MDKRVEDIVLAIAQLLRENADVRGYADPLRVRGNINPRDRAIVAGATTEGECVQAIGAYMLITDGISVLRRVYESLDIKSLRFDFLAEKTDEEIGRLSVYEDGGPDAFSLSGELEGDAADPYIVHLAAVANAWRRFHRAQGMFQEARSMLNLLTDKSAV